MHEVRGHFQKTVDSRKHAALTRIFGKHRLLTDQGGNPVKLSVRTLLCGMLLCVTVFAQTTAVSQISGTIQDGTGLPIAAAEIRATQTDTGFTRTAMSGQDGGYTLPNLPVGPYR